MPTLSSVQSAVGRLLEKYPDSVYGYDASNVHVAPWAVVVAEELHRQFGDDVHLDVGAFPYPPGRESRFGHRPPRTSNVPELPVPDEVGLELDGPVEVSSGHTAWHACRLHNRTDSDLWVTTGYAVVVDTHTGEVVGGSAAPRFLTYGGPIVPAGTTVDITLVIGTASFTPRLGYAVPPGTWGFQAVLGLPPDPRRTPRRRSPVFPLTITD